MKNSVLCYLEETSARFPDKAAIVDSHGSITFSELRCRALRISEEIRHRFAVKKRPVLVYVPKSASAIVCFMGILYSGNFYTPTDVQFPFDKVNRIIKKLEPALYLSDTENQEKLIENGIPQENIINIDDISDNASVEYDNMFERTIDTDIVYTLFTSGSTGVPKGVAITNRSIIDYIDWARECYQIDESHIIGNQAPFYFDNSTLDIYLMLSTGATLHIIPTEYYAFLGNLVKYIAANKINTIFWVPSVLINVANFKLLDSIDCSCLKKILFAGEVMPNKHLNYWRKKLPKALYSNLYGPTEITVDCSYYIVDRDFEDEEPLPIGKPCRNSDILVLDENNRLITDDNVLGELCVRGSSLAVGYWNDKEKTEEVFVQNPLNPYYPERIYRTGDLVYYNKYGELEFAGRKDFQIKHSGYRIELGEIESATMGKEEISGVCASYHKEKKQIVLFYQGEISKEELKDYLLTIIPKYMVPTMYFPLKRFPYNDNGKIDRKQLEEQYLK